MHHTLDGHQLEVGQQLYDVAFGPCKVVSLNTNASVTVRFSTLRTLSYTDGVNRRFTHRTLFHHNPVMVAPPPNAEAWGVVAAAVRVLLDQMRLRGMTGE